MKKFYFGVLVFFTVFVYSCDKKINLNNHKPIEKIFNYNHLERGLCVAKDSIVKFYWLDDNFSWIEASNYEFKIPPDCKDIFSFGGRFGIITDTNIIFYQNMMTSNFMAWDMESYPWYEDQKLQFTLPQNFQTVFTILFDIAVVADNKLNLYSFDEDINEWKILPNTEFELPPNWQYIFEFDLNGFCIVTDDKMKIYWYSWFYNSWSEYYEMVFNLPENYQDVFTNSQGSKASRERYEAEDWEWISVMKDNILKFYYYPKNSWKEIENIEFKFK